MSTEIDATRRAVLTAAAAGLTLAATASAGEPSKTLKPAERQQLLSPFSLNTETWWRDLPFQKRFDAAARAGFTQVEFWNVDSSEERDPKALAKLCRGAGLTISQFCMDMPNLPKADPAKVREGVLRTIDCAHTFGTNLLCVYQHEIVPGMEGMTKAEMLYAFQARLTEIVPLLADARMIAMVEPFNPFNHPLSCMHGTHDLLGIIRAIDSPWVKVLWDFFHVQRSEGNLIDGFRKAIDQVVYVQIADSPDRREPGTGEINHEVLLREVRKAGYKGVFGLECMPTKGTEAVALAAVERLAHALATA